jgi:hypothetical protein
VGQEPQDSDFKVSDRRRFSPEGEPLDEAESAADGSAESSAEASSEAAEPNVSSTEPIAGAAERPYERPMLPTASFELLVVSLAMQARMELSPGGEGEEGPSPNLDLARHTIDLLAVLQQKTKGNLTLEESRLLENSLTELRFRYVQRVEEINQRAKA